MKIKDMPQQNRPRERFLKHGPETLSDSELMAILLRTGTIQENVVDMSNRLIAEYGLDKLFDCSLKELQAIKGIGPNKAMQILAMAELGKRYKQAQKPIKKISCAEDVFDYFHERLKDKKQEEFHTLILNNQNIIIKSQLITKGILNSSIVHPREIFKDAIRNSAAKVILVHNHPSGDPNPSKEDLEITEKIMSLGREMDIQVLDHVIISKESFWSWEEKQKLTNIF